MNRQSDHHSKRQPQEVTELAQKFEQRRIVLRISNYLLWAGMLLSLILGPKIYPYGLIIFGIFLLVKLAFWRVMRKSWERAYTEAQTLIGWAEQGIDVVYEPRAGIEHEILKSYDLSPGRRVASYLSLERISADFSELNFQASDFSISFEKPKRVAPYPFITGAWLIFETYERDYPSLRLKKRMLSPENLKAAQTLEQLLDPQYPNSGCETLSDGVRERFVRLLTQYQGVVYLFAHKRKLHIVFENVFVNYKPALNQKISPPMLRSCTFEDFSGMRQLAVDLHANA